MPINNLAIQEFISLVKFNADGLVAAIAQDYNTGQILMLAWMNKESLQLTLEKQEMVYFSRSRKKIWHKGETSGHIQKIYDIALDCDGDALLAKVEQIGGIACHTGRNHCFYQSYTDKGIVNNAEVIKSSDEIYGKTNTTN